MILVFFMFEFGVVCKIKIILLILLNGYIVKNSFIWKNFLKDVVSREYFRINVDKPQNQNIYLHHSNIIKYVGER